MTKWKGRAVTPEEIARELANHEKWRRAKSGSKQGDLSGADLRGAQLERAKLGSVNLRHSCLAGANLREADLVEADLSYADLTGANLEGADFEDAELERVTLSGANMRRADLAGANLRGATVSQEQLASTRGAPVIQPDDDRAELSDTQLVFDFDVPEGASDDALSGRVQHFLRLADRLHRAHGGSGLRISDCQTFSDIGVLV